TAVCTRISPVIRCFLLNAHGRFWIDGRQQFAGGFAMREQRRLRWRALFASVFLIAGVIMLVAQPAFAASTVTFSTSSLASGISVNVTGTFSNGACQSGKSLNVTFSSPGPSSGTGMCPSSTFTYSYPTTLGTTDVYTLQSSSPASPATVP